MCTFQVASITKVMTFLVAHDGIASGVVGLGDHVPVMVTVGGTTADLKVRSGAALSFCGGVVVDGVGKRVQCAGTVQCCWRPHGWRDASTYMRCDVAAVSHQIGDVLTMQDLLYGMMLPSGNDAATAIAGGYTGHAASFLRCASLAHVNPLPV